MWKAPSAEELSQSLRGAVRAEIPGSDPWLFPSNLYVVLKVMAQAMRGMMLRLEWLQRQAFVSLAEGDALERHGGDIGITRLAAAVATGSLSVVTTAGTTIPQGTRFIRSDGAAFVTLQETTAVGTPTVLTIAAAEAGQRGNTDPGATLTIETPIAGVGAGTVTAGGITGGAEIENDISLRSRILDRKRNPPHGGSPAEYVGWARSMPAVTRVFVRRATPQPGSVTVLFMMDATYTNGIPGGDDIARMAAIMNDLAPANANVVVAGPVPLPVNVTVTGLVPNSQAVRDEVRAELLAMFRRRAQPGTATASFIFSRSWIAEAVAMATGEFRHVLTAPAADVVCGENEIAVLGVLTFA